MTGFEVAVRYPNGARVPRFGCEVALAWSDSEVSLYRINGNWDVYQLLDHGDGFVAVGRYLRTEAVGL
jgi:hypothetical protein